MITHYHQALKFVLHSTWSVGLGMCSTHPTVAVTEMGGWEQPEEDLPTESQYMPCHTIPLATVPPDEVSVATSPRELGMQV